MNLIPIKEWYVRENVKEDKNYFYIFTDNAARTSGDIFITEDSWYMRRWPHAKRGNSTQAVIRGLNNSYPISTMWASGIQWNDDLLHIFKTILDREISDIILAFDIYKGCKYNNEMPFGDANISKMKYVAPKCWEYLNEQLLKINIKNN